MLKGLKVIELTIALISVSVLLLGILVFMIIWFTKFVGDTNKQTMQYMKAIMAKDLHDFNTNNGIQDKVKTPLLYDENVSVEDADDELFKKIVKQASIVSQEDE